MAGIMYCPPPRDASIYAPFSLGRSAFLTPPCSPRSRPPYPITQDLFNTRMVALLQGLPHINRHINDPQHAF